MRKHPIIGRDLAEEMGYIHYPPVKTPNLSSTPFMQDVLKLQASRGNQDHIEVLKPQIQASERDSITNDGKQHHLPVTKDLILNEFSDVFTEIGTLPGGECTLKLKDNVQPVQQPPR